MNYLCRHHRQELFSQPEKASEYWHQWMRQGGSLIDSGQWREACSFLGCCFELCEWIIQQGNHPGGDHQIVDRYLVSGHILAECLGRSGRIDLELHYLLTVHTSLIERVKNRLPDYWLLKQHLQISLMMLNRYCKQRGSFKGYYDCCVEAEWYIKQCVN